MPERNARREPTLAGAVRRRVLIVDDEESMRLLLGRLIESIPDVEITLADGCDAALQLVRSGAYDLILLDLLMPGIGGIEVLKRIRASSPNRTTPVVIVSVMGDSDTRIVCQSMGANGYVVKPIERKTLIATVEEQLAGGGRVMSPMQPAMPDIRIQNVEALGKPLGQYSHMTRVRGGHETLYIAGMLAPGGDFDAQCSGVFRQIDIALRAAGAGWGSVVQFTTYMVDAQDIPRFMAWRLREFPRMFPDGKYPPNTLLIIDRLVGEQFLIEVQTIAVT